MPRIRIMIMFGMLIAGVALGNSVGLGQSAEGDDAPSKPAAEEKDEAKDEVKEAEAPKKQFGYHGMSEEHQRLDDWQGDWHVHFKVWNVGVEEAMEFDARAHRVWEMNGTHLVERRVDYESQGNAERRHLYTWDPFASEYTATLYGAGISSMFNYRGSWDEEKQRFILTGGFKLTGADIHERMEITPVVDGEQTFYVYGWGTMPDGTKVDEWLHIEITYKRHKTIGVTPESMQRMMSDMAPSAAHTDDLGALVGEWECNFVVTPTEFPPMKFSGTATFKSVMGGRFIEESLDANSEAFGPMVSKVVHGFDNASQRFDRVLYADNGTAMMPVSGTKDEAGNIVLLGKYYDSINERWVQQKWVQSPIADDAFTLEVFYDYETIGVWESAAKLSYSKNDE